MLILLLLSGLISFFGCVALLRAGQESSRRYWQLHVPQRFHIGHVPRLGGAAMLLACMVGWLWMVVAERYFGITSSIPFDLPSALGWIAVAVVASVPGLVEDVTHEMQPRWRLIGTTLAALLAVLIFGIAVPRLGIPGLQAFWDAVPWL